MNDGVMREEGGSSSEPTRFIAYQLQTPIPNPDSTKKGYAVKLPSSVDVFSALSENIDTLTDPNVKRQVIRILGIVDHILQQQIAGDGNIQNRLSKLHVIEQEDFSALIEWNFQHFRVGFLVEPEETESSYYWVSENKSRGSFKADSEKVGDDLDRFVVSIVEYVIRTA